MGVLIVLQFAAILALLARLVRSQINLPCFAVFLVVDLGLGVFSWSAAPSRSMNLAVQVWIWGQFASAALWVLIADELRRRVLVRYRRIGITGLLIVMAAISISGLVVWLSASDPRNGLQRLTVFIPRVTSSVLAITMGFLAVFISRYPALQAPNTIAHGKMLGFYFAQQSLSWLAINIGTDPHALSIAGMILSLLCFVSWTLVLSAAGEVAPRPAAPIYSVAEAVERSEQALARLRILS